jgi:hypothetical protein
MAAGTQIQGVYRWQNPDQNKHNQAHPFLTIIGAVRKTDAGAGKDQKKPNPPWWRFACLGWSVEFGTTDQELG